MKLAQKSSRRFTFAIASMGFLAAAGSGLGSRALAFDDKPAWNSVMELVGVGSGDKSEPIDYRERSKLVVPPSRLSLPEPRTAEGEWFSGHSQQKAAPGGRTKDESDKECVEKQKDCWYPIPGVRWSGSARQKAAQESPRKYLVEPPDVYTTPTKTVAAGADDTGDSSGWINPLTAIRKTAGKLFDGGH